MRERELFAQAMQLPAEARFDFLDDACGENASMRARLGVLLQTEQELGSFLEAPAILGNTAELPHNAAAMPTTDKSGSTIGPYHLIQQIGEGGFGVVYLAEQKEPVKRKVALKVIKPGMDSKQVLARFEAERRALALMDHPHIAKVLDCGTAATGVPYFVMEFVQGTPIADFCDQHKLATRQRLELFVLVCRAVQHAHLKGVIHRDIKPSNVLVSTHDGTAVPKIIDFGIAKAIDAQNAEATICTENGQMVGTPLYMSPEQAGICGLDVDTRTDVYSLGVLLYELLTGTTPFEKQQLKHVAYDEIRRIIRDVEPPRPSTKISALGATATTVSACRQTDPRKLSALLRNELDWIVMKALEKDRDRRYDTALSFANDVQRYLQHQPIEAHPPSSVYRFCKFARRNKRSLLTAAALVAMLVTGSIVCVWQAARATYSEQRAKAEAATSEAVIAFINDDLLGPSAPHQEPDRDLKVREALDRAAAKIDGRFPQQPLVEAAIRHAVGTAYLTLGEYGNAEKHLLKAVRIRQLQLGGTHRKTLGSTSHLALATCNQGRFAEAEKMHDKVLQIQRRILGPEHPDTLGSLMNLSAAVFEQGRYAEAEQLTRKLLEMQRRVLGAEHPNTLKSMMNLASNKRMQSKFAEAEEICRNLIQIQQRVLRPEHPDTLGTMSVLANALLGLGRHAESQQLHQEVYDLKRRTLGPEHPSTLNSMGNLGLALFHESQLSAAEQLQNNLLEIRQRVLGPDHPDTLQTLMNVANVRLARGQAVEAEQLHREVLAKQIESLGDEHPNTLSSKFNLANAINAQGRYIESEAQYRDLLEQQRRVFGTEHRDTLKTMMNLAVALHKQRQFAAAAKLRHEIVDRQTRLLGPKHPDTLASLLNLANTLNAQRRDEAAEQCYLQTLQTMERVLGETHRYTLKCSMALADFVESRNRYVEAERRWRQVQQRQLAALGPEHPDTRHSTNALAWLLAFSAPPGQRNPAEAVELAQQLVTQQPVNNRYWQTLGQVQFRAGKLAEAEQTLQKSLQLSGPNQHDILTLALVNWQLDRKELARKLYAGLRDLQVSSNRLIKLKEELESLIGATGGALSDRAT